MFVVFLFPVLVIYCCVISQQPKQHTFSSHSFGDWTWLCQDPCSELLTRLWSKCQSRPQSSRVWLKQNQFPSHLNDGEQNSIPCSLVTWATLSSVPGSFSPRASTGEEWRSTSKIEGTGFYDLILELKGSKSIGPAHTNSRGKDRCECQGMGNIGGHVRSWPLHPSISVTIFFQSWFKEISQLFLLRCSCLISSPKFYFRL